MENWATQPVIFKIPKVLSMKIIIFCNMITRSQVVVCDLGTSNEEALAHWGAVAPKTNKETLISIKSKIIRQQILISLY